MTRPYSERVSAQSHEDPRWLRTRQALLAALLELDASALAGVSVGSLSRAAGVHRTSFYNHFTSLPEAAAAALGVGMRDIMRADENARRAGHPPDQVALQTIGRTLDYLGEHRDLFFLASDWRSPGGLRGVADILSQQVRGYRAHYADQAGQPSEVTEAEDVYVASAIAGFYAVVLHGGLRLDRDRAAGLLYRLFPAWLRSAPGPAQTLSPPPGR